MPAQKRQSSDNANGDQQPAAKQSRRERDEAEEESEGEDNDDDGEAEEEKHEPVEGAEGESITSIFPTSLVTRRVFASPHTAARSLCNVIEFISLLHEVTIRLCCFRFRRERVL